MWVIWVDGDRVLSHELVTRTSSSDGDDKGVVPALFVGPGEVAELDVLTVLSLGIGEFGFEEGVVDGGGDCQHLFPDLGWEIPLDQHGFANSVAPDESAVSKGLVVLSLRVAVVDDLGPTVHESGENWPRVMGPVDEGCLVACGVVAVGFGGGEAADEAYLVGVEDASVVGGLDTVQVVDELGGDVEPVAAGSG